ncbi:CcmD family protein [Runella rosea]|uniref:CcmD family protein n=2 Tax=Runella TaxID=105 RepID=A0A344TS63_9BACT|nr:MULTISPECIES: CcmD family protein [Runella]AXE21484.1 CcmD family protein [Runella rosea]MCP1384017.1 CcmD family protein [Runella salmonicolor]
MRTIFYFFLFTLVTNVNLFAQQSVVEEVAMADQMRADGKIWVVVAVISVIFAGIIAFLVNIDRKVSKLEKQLKK